MDALRFARELDRRVHLRRVREDLASGLASGVDDTPTFFIDGLR